MQEVASKSGEGKPKKLKDKKQKKSVKSSDKPVQPGQPACALDTSCPESVVQAPVHKKTAPPASPPVVKIPKSQARWYRMHTIRQDPHRPGKKLFSWHNTEAKVNSQFRRITKATAYPSTGPPSKPTSQEYLRRWEKCARENSYIINNAAGFNRCTSELQEKMSSNVAMLCSRINKGKAPKEVTSALTDLKDLMAFHQSVSVAMGTTLQHLVDSVFVQLANLILICHDAYLEHVKPGIKQDTWLHLRNVPMFGYGLFPDTVIATAEQDIIKHEASGTVLRPGLGASQQSGWRTANRYRPYDRREHRPAGTDQ